MSAKRPPASACHVSTIASGTGSPAPSRTCPWIRIAPGASAATASGPAAHGSPIAKNGPAVVAVHVAPGRVRLPDLYERVAKRLALGVENAAAHRDALPDRLAGVLAREVVVELAEDPVRAELRPRDLRERVRQVDERLL